MTAYVISEVEVLDQEAADDYKKLAAASIAMFDGRYLARGAVPEVVEGTSTNRQIVLVEFPTLERAHEWYASPTYTQALCVRERALERRLLFVEGLAQPAV